MKVKELISEPSKWTQHVIARNSDGKRVAANDSSATCFCLYGAIKRCYVGIIAEEVLSHIQNFVPHRDAITWNDAPGRTHAEVLELVTRLDI